MDDGQLVERARRGDDAAFELLVRRHTPTVWRLARSLVDDDGTAEEVAQDTFVKAHRGLAGFRAEAAVATWLHSICRRTAMDHRRRRRLNVVSLDNARRRPAGTAPNDERLVLQEAIASLGDDEREAFALVAVLGYRSEEAAAEVGVPPSTLRSRVARARRQLAEALLGDDRNGTQGSGNDDDKEEMA